MNGISMDNFAKVEMDIFDAINKKQNTIQLMSEHLKQTEESLSRVLESLVSKNLLIVNKGVYSYPVTFGKDDYVVLEGNILLPCSVIKIPERNIMYVTRGNWYEFPIDFDVRRIIWNIKFVEGQKSTLAELIRTSILKERKSKIQHNPEYDSIKNKIAPYSPEIGLLITSVGEQLTSVNMIFRIRFDNAFNTVYNGFTVQSEISTQELLDELNKSTEERDFTRIQINRLYDVDDFIFAKNEIPISFEDNKLTYAKLTGVRNGYELTYYTLDGNTQSVKKQEVTIYDSLEEVREKFRSCFEHYAGQILAKCDVFVNLD